MLDFLLKRYKNMDLIYELKPKKLFNLYSKAKEKDFEETAWQFWLTLDNDAKKATPFSKFLDDLRKEEPKNTDKRSDEEIIQDAEHILTLMKRSE